MDINVHTPQSVQLPSGCCTCAALLTVNRSSAPGHVSLRPPGAMHSLLTAVFHLCGHSGEWPSSVSKSTGSTISHMSGASRWWAVQCGPTRSTVRSRYTSSEPPSSMY